MNESLSHTLLYALAAAVPAPWVWGWLGVGEKRGSWTIAVRFAGAALLVLVWGALGLSPAKVASFCLLLGAAWLPEAARKVWGTVAALFFAGTLFVEALMVAWHGQHFPQNTRILLVFCIVLMLSLKSFSFVRSSFLFVFFLVVGIFACL